MLKRLTQIALLVTVTLTMLGAGNPSNRFDKIGHSLMCTCSCGEVLLECNHVGCPTSGPMIDELRSHLAAGMADKDIFTWFANKYGAIALAAPIRGGFDLVAWIMPFAILALGLVGITWLLRHWRDRHASAAALPGSSQLPPHHASHLRDRIRQETTYEP